MRSFFLINFFLGLVCCASGQEITILSDDYVKLKNDLSKFQDSIKVLNGRVCAKDKELSEQVVWVKSLKEQVEYLQAENNKRDSRINKLDSVISQHRANQNRLVAQNERLQELSDRNTAKLANGRLYFKYSDKLVLSSIKSLQELKSEKVKRDFNQALTLLQKYKIYSEELKSIILSVQTIEKDLLTSKHRAEEYKRKSLSILRGSLYYQEIYSKKNTGVWSIPYLDNVINLAKSIISKHNPVDYEFANYTTLVEML